MSLRTVAAIRRLSGPARFQRRRPVRPWRVGRSAERRDSAPLVGGLIHIPRPTVSTPDLNGCGIESIPRPAERGVVPPETPKLGRLRPEGVDAVSPDARRPETPRSGLLWRQLLSGALTCAAAVLLVSCRGFDVGEGLSWPAPDPEGALVVQVKNSTTANFYLILGGCRGLVTLPRSTQVGLAEQYAYWQSFCGAAPQDHYFEIARGGTTTLEAVPLVRVSFRLLKYQPMDATTTTKHVTVTITEPRAGAFEATTLDTEWIEILSVVPLP